MAEEKKEEKRERREGRAEGKTEGKAEAKPEGKKKSPLMLIIIIVVAGLTIGGGGVVSWLMFKSKGGPAKQEDQKKDAEKQKKGAAKAGSGGVIYKDNKEPITFVVNLSGGRNFLKADIALELSDKLVEKEIDEKLPKIKDTILLVLADQTAESIADNKGKARLKDDILKRLNSYLNTGKIENIYFTGFVVQ